MAKKCETPSTADVQLEPNDLDQVVGGGSGDAMRASNSSPQRKKPDSGASTEVWFDTDRTAGN